MFGTLCELWPQPERRTGLRIVAVTAIGILRLAIKIRGAERGERQMTAVFQDLFAALKAEIRQRTTYLSSVRTCRREGAEMRFKQDTTSRFVIALEQIKVAGVMEYLTLQIPDFATNERESDDKLCHGV